MDTLNAEPPRHSPIPRLVRGRFGLLAQSASLLVTGWILWETGLRWRVAHRSLASVAGHAIGYALLACAWSAAMVFVLYLALPRSASRNLLWSTLRTAAVAIWFAPATILLTQLSPAALIASLALAVTATRLLYSEWLSLRPPPEETPAVRVMFAEARMRHPAIRRELATGLMAAFCLQSGCTEIAFHHPLTAGALLVLSAGILTMFAMTTGVLETRRPADLPRAIYGILLTIFLATGLTVSGLRVMRLRGGDGNGNSDTGSPVANAREVLRDLFYGDDAGKPPAPSKPPEPDRNAANLGGMFAGIVLWPEIRKVTHLVAPPPQRSVMGGIRLERPYTIPFGGEYWFFRYLFRRPPPSSYKERGNPAALSFSTTDRWPLQMEAHQTLDEPLDLSCCRKVQVVIWNADRYPGTVSLELVALDDEAPLTVGIAPVNSAPNLAVDPIVAVAETLDFPLAKAVHHCTELKVVFRRAKGRADKSAKIAIDRFVLVP